MILDVCHLCLEFLRASQLPAALLYTVEVKTASFQPGLQEGTRSLGSTSILR